MTGFGALPPLAARLKPSCSGRSLGVERPLLNARRIRGSGGREVPIERRR
jgi:hypothetical protein